MIDKRGDYIKKLINWQLSSNNLVVLKRDSVECEFVNNIITFHEDENTINEIDIDKKTFRRENKDFMFKIDFINQTFNYHLKIEDLSIENAQIDANLKTYNDHIILQYNLGDETKEIIIHIL